MSLEIIPSHMFKKTVTLRHEKERIEKRMRKMRERERERERERRRERSKMNESDRATFYFNVELITTMIFLHLQ